MLIETKTDFLAIVTPASSTDNAFVRFDGATGKIVQNGQTIETDAGYVGTGGVIPSDHLQASSGDLLGTWIRIYNSDGKDVGMRMYSGGTYFGGFLGDSTALVTSFYGPGSAGGVVHIKNGKTVMGSWGDHGAGAALKVVDIFTGDNDFMRIGSSLGAGQWTGIQLGWCYAGAGYNKSILAFKAFDGYNRGSFHMLLHDVANASDSGLTDSKFEFDYNGNMAVGYVNGFPTSMKVGICMVNGTAPTANVTNGFACYSSSGKPTFRDSSGAIITLAQQAKASYNNWAALSDLLNALAAMGIIDAA